MAVLKPWVNYTPRVKLNSSAMYSRPSLAPIMVGVGGRTGQARYNTNRQFEYTLRQMAVSPFSVNSKAYMQRIRDEYGYADDGTYEALGTVGGVIGAGVGAMYGAGYMAPALTSGKFWQKSAWQNPWTGKFNPKRAALHNSFRGGKKYETALTYNNAVNKYNDALQALDKAKDISKQQQAYDDALSIWKKAKYMRNGNAQKEAARVAYTAASDALDQSKDAVKAATQTVTDAQKFMNTSLDAVKAVDKTADVVTAGTKIATKVSGITPWVGMAFDVAGLGLSVAGLQQSIEQRDTLNTILNSIAVTADAASVVGDVLEFTPLAPIGFGISLVGAVVSIGVSAIQGFLVGQTVGRSLSPEGVKAQQLFAENLYSSMLQRPVTTAASLTTMYGIPLLTGRIAAGNLQKANLLGKMAIRASRFLSQNALGNQIRAGVSMMALQGVSGMTTRFEDSVGLAPTDPDKVNFVSAISLYGDINDNLYGATRVKSILLGLAANDSKAMTDAIARSWGNTDDIYKSVTFDDIRQAAGVELGNFGNSLVSTLGELLVDPQNYNEVIIKYSKDNTTNAALRLINKTLDYESAKALMTDDVALDNTLGVLVDKHGLLSARVMSKEDRARYLRRLISAYLDGDAFALRHEMTNMFTHRTRGSRGNAEVVVGDPAKQAEILSNYLDTIFKGDFRYVLGSSAEKDSFKRKLLEYEVIQTKINNKEKLTDEQQKIQKNAERTFRYLTAMYGEESTPELVNSFIRDLDIKIDNQHMNAIYTTYDNLRHHMDNIDIFSRKLNTVANPTTGIAKNLIFVLGKASEYLRSKFTSADQKSVTILKHAELQKNLSNLIEPKEIDEAFARDEEARGYSNKGVINLIDRERQTNKDLQGKLEKETEADLKQAKEEHAAQKQKIQEAKDSLKTLEESLERDKQDYIYHPRSYTYNKKRRAVFVSEAELPNLEAELKKFETNEDGTPMGAEAIKTKIANTRKTSDTLRYLDVRDALMDYKYHMKYFDNIKDVIVRAKSAIKIMDTLTGKLNDDMIAIIDSLGMFKVYANTIETVKQPDGTFKTVQTFDKENWERLEKELEKPDSEVTKLMLEYGLLPTYTVTKDDGTKETFRGLKAITLSKVNNAPLSFEFKPRLNYMVTKIIQDALLSTDINSMIDGTVKLPDTLTKENWAKLHNDTEAKFTIIRDFLESLDLSKEDLYKLLDEDVLLDIYRNVDAILSSTGTKTIPYGLDELNQDRLRAIVISNIYDKQNKTDTATVKVIDKVIDMFKAVDADVKKIMQELKDDENAAQIELIITAQLSKLNYTLHNNTAFKFIKSAFRPGRIVGDEPIGLFLSNDARVDLLPPYVSKKQLEDSKAEATDYTEKRIIRDYLNSPVVQELKEQRESEFAYIKDRHNNKAEQTEVDAKAQAAQRATIRRNQQNRRKSDIKGQVKREASKRIKHFSEFTLNEISNLQIGSDITKGSFFKTPYMKNLDRRRALSILVARVLSGRVDDLHLEKINFNITTSKYAIGSDSDISKLKTYFDILKKFNKKSNTHTTFLKTIAERILSIVENSKEVALDTNKLVKLTKLYASETDHDLLIRRIVETYRKQGTIEISAKMDHTKKATKIFSKSVYSAALNYMYDHSEELPYVPNTKMEFDDADIEHFINRLKDENDQTLSAARQEIFNNASEIFHDSLFGGDFSAIQNKLSSIADALRDFEQKEVRNISERYYTVSTDVAKKLIFGDTRMLSLLEDILKFENMDENSEFSTGLFQTLSLLNQYIAEDHSHKQTLNCNDVQKIEIDKSNRIIFTIKDVKEPMTLFTLMFKYHLNLKGIMNILDTVTRTRAKEGLPATTNIELSTRVRTEYNHLLNKYGGILSHNTLDIDEVAFKAQGGTDKELSIVQDVDIELLYNNMRLLDVLETNRTKNPNGKPRGVKYEKMREIYSQQIKDIYQRALHEYNNNAINTIYGVDKSLLTQASALLLHVLKSKLSDKIKKNIMRNVFFNQYRVVSAVANAEHIEKLEDNVKSLNKQLSKAAPENKKRIEDKIKGIEKRVADYKLRNENIEHVEYRVGEPKAFDRLYEYLLKNLDDAVAFYSNRIDSDSGQFVLARTVDAQGKPTNKFVLVEHYAPDRTSNVTDVSKGIPNFNIHLGETVIAMHSDTKAQEVSSRILEVFETTMYKDKDLKIAAASNSGVIITVKDGTDLTTFKDSKTKLLKDLRLGSGYEVYMMTETQYKDIVEMERTGSYEVVYDYVVKMENGKIKGYVPNIINVKSNQTKVDAYISDLELLPKQNVDATVEKIIKFAEVYNKYVIVNKAYLTNVAFNKSETFQRMIKFAKVNKAFLSFVSMLDPKKTGTFYNFNIETIAKIFFKDEFIKQQDDGTFFNVGNLKYRVKDLSILNQLQTTMINGESLLSLIQKSIWKLQQDFGTSDVNFDMRYVMPDEFETQLRTLTNQAYKVFEDLRTTHNTIYNKILPRLLKKQGKNFITDYTAEEIIDRRRYTKTLDKPLRTPSGKYNPAITDPYGSTVQRGIRNRSITALKEGLYEKNEYGDTVESIVATEARAKRQAQKERVKSINDSRANRPRSTIRYKVLLDLYYDAAELNDLTEKEPGVHAPMKYKDFTFSKRDELKEYTDGLYDVVQDIKKRMDNETDPVVKQQLYDRIKRFLPKKTADADDGTYYALNTKNDFYNYVISMLVGDYVANITDDLVPTNYWELIGRAISESGMDPDKFTPIFDRLWKEREAKREARDFRKLDKYRKAANGKIDIEDDIFDYIFVRDEFEPEIKGLFTEVINEVEEFLFTDKTPVAPLEVPKDIEYNNFKEYIEKQPEEQQEFYKFALKYFPTVARFRTLDMHKATTKEGLSYNADGELVNKQGVVMDLETHYFKHALNILNRRKKAVVKFNNAREVYRLLSTPVLDDSTEFKNYLINEYFFKAGVGETAINNYLRQFGINTPQQRNILLNYKTVNDILEGIDDITVEEMYALTAVINMVKEQFLKEHYSNKRYSWKQVHNDYILKPIEDGIDALETLEYTGTFKKNVFENNVIDGIFDSTNFIFESLRYVKDTNSILGAIVVPSTEKINEIFDVNPVYVTTKESNAFTLSREIGRSVTEVLFKPERSVTAIGEQKANYTRALGDAVSDFIAERHAEDLNSVGSNSSTYNKIRDLYTKVMRDIKRMFKEKDFVRVADVASALSVMLNNPDNVGFYAKEFGTYIAIKLKGDAKALKDLDTKINDIAEFFTNSGYLQEMDPQLVKATLGYIMQYKYKALESDQSEFIKRIIDFTGKQETFKHTYKLNQLQSIAYQLTPSRSPEELSEIIYGKGTDKLSAEERKNFNSILDLQKFIDTQVHLDPTRLYDTYDFVYEGTREIYNDESTAVLLEIKAAEKVTEAENKIISLKGTRTRINNEKGHGFVNDQEAVVALEETERLVNKLLNEKEVAKLAYNNAVVRKDIEKNKVLNEILLSTPELIDQFVKERQDQVDKQELEILTKKQALEKKFSKVILDEYNNRKAFYKDYAEFFTSVSYKLFNMSRKDGVDATTLYDMFKEELNNMDVNSTKETIAWLATMTSSEKAYQTKDAQYKATTKIKDGTKEINYTKAAERIKKDMDEIEGLELRLESYKTYVPEGADDVDEQMRINIAKAYMAKILNKLNGTIKSTYNDVFKKAFVEELDKKHINTIAKSVSSANAKIEKEIEQLIKVFKKHGILPNIDKALQSIKTITGKLDPTEDKKYIDELKKLEARVKNVLYKRDHNAKIMDSLNNTKVVSVEDMLKKSVEAVLIKNGFDVTPANIIRVVEYLSGDDTKEINKELTVAAAKEKDATTKYNEAVAERDKLNRYIYSIPEELESLEKTLSTLKNNLDKLTEKRRQAVAVSSLDKEYTNSNLGTYKKLYELDPRMSDSKVLDIIVKETQKSFEGDLNTLIRSAGDFDIHNPVVDVLITRFNYIAQMKKSGQTLPETFIVLDMETVTDETGNKVPYQMTMIKEDKGKVNVVNTYFNNRIFHTEDSEDVAKKTDELTTRVKPQRSYLLDAFYKQQATILRKNNPDLTDEDVTKKTDELITRVKTQPNHIEFINTYITELNGDSNVPIIAHNGMRFDFPNYDVFLQNYARRLLSNLYYQQIKENDPDKIKARLEKSTLGALLTEGFDDRLITEYQTVVNKILDKINRNEPVTLDEQKQMDKLNDAILVIRAYRSIDNAELKENIIVNQELKDMLLSGEDSEANKVKGLVYKYVVATDDNERNQIVTDLVSYYRKGYALHEGLDQDQEIEDLVKDMLKATTEQYHLLRDGLAEIDYTQVDGLKTRRREIYTNVTKGIIETNSKTYKPGDLLSARLRTLNQIEENIKYLRNSKDNVETTIANIQTKRQALIDQRTALEAERTQLKETLDRGITSQEQVIKELIDFAKRIQDATANPVYNANKKIKAYIRDSALDDQTNSQINTGLLRLQQDEQIRTMKQKLDGLKRVRDYIINELLGKKDISQLEEILRRENIDVEILRVTTENERTILKQKYTEQLKELRSLVETVGNETFFSDKLEDKILLRIHEERSKAKEKIDELSAEVLRLWNDDETKKLLGKSFETMELKNVYSYDSYKKYWKILEAHSELKDDVRFTELVYALSNNSVLNKALEVYNAKDTRVLYETSEVHDLIVHGIQKDIHIVESKIATLNSIKLSSNVEDTAMNLLNSAFNSFLAEIKHIDTLNDTIDRTDIINILSGKGRKTSEMSEEAKIIEAKRKMPPEVLEGLEDEHVTRMYDNILKNDDKVAIILDPEKAYSTRNLMDDGSEMITVSVYDEVHDTLQKMSFSTKFPKQVTFTLTYNYTTVGKELVQHKPKEYKFSTILTEEGDPANMGYDKTTTVVDVKDKLKKLFNYNNKDGLRPGIKDDMIFKEDGKTDSSKVSIERLINLYLRYETTFRTYKKPEGADAKPLEHFDKHFNKFFTEVKNDQGLQLADLKRINMTKVMEQRFKQYLDVVQYAKRGDNYQDIMRVYAGLSNKLLSKFNSLVPGKVLNMIPAEYSNNFILKYDDKTLYDYGFDLANSSEGSAGSSFMLRNFYTVDVPFRHNTNTVRTVLSTPKLYAKFTSIKVINDLYKLEDADTKGTAFMDLFDQLDSPHKARLEELLIKQYKGKRINVFTPNVLTDNMYEKFNNDTLHKNGVNLQVAFANDPRAHEDTILVDYNDAQALGWLEGNKTWLGLYGFKGAIRYIKGLRDTYGATFVANANSVKSRGAYGALLEMSINTIRKYLIKDYTGISNEAKATLKKYDKEIKMLFTPTEDGKIIVDQGVDYNKLLKQIDPNMVNLLTKTTVNKVTDIELFKASTGKKETLTVDKMILRGELYVTLDSEHTADHMAHTAEVDSQGGINYVLKDHKSSVRGGVVISPSVVYTMIAKGNVDWQKAFPQDTTMVELYANVMNFGLDYLINNYKVEVNGVLNPVKTIDNIIDKTKANTLASSVNEYMFYKMKYEDPTTSVDDKAYAEYRMDYLNQSIKQKALDSLTGLHGAYYQSIYKKHPGIRQQLVANTDLGLGEIRISREGYEALIEMKPGWLQKNNQTLNDEEVKKVLDKAKDKRITDEQFADYLRNEGIYGYVVSVRSPVQDYNAVPVVKVVGTSTHKATEANAYLYKMIGGDNDGDTIGMAALDSEGYNAIKALDATKESYYDKAYTDYKTGKDKKSYIDRVEEDFKVTDPDNIEQIDARYAYVGKKTFSDKVRDHYTWDELYLITYGDRIKTLINNMDISVYSDVTLENKLLEEISSYTEAVSYRRTLIENEYKENKTQITKQELDKLAKERVNQDDYIAVAKRIYMNVIIRNGNGGYDTNETYNKESYFNPEVVNKFYEEHREEILKRILFDKQVQEGTFKTTTLITRDDVIQHSDTLSKTDKAEINKGTINDFLNRTDETAETIKEKIMFNRFYNRIMQNTINRIQVSKRGVNIFGGNRKQQLVASVLSMFARINNSPDGSVWHRLKLSTTDAKGNVFITVKSIAEGLIKSTHKIEDLVRENTRESFITLVTSKYLVKGINASDFDTEEVLGMVYDNYTKADKTKVVLSSLSAALRSKNAQELIKHFKTHVMKDPMIDIFVKRLEADVLKEPKAWINNVDEQWIKTLYFGRFDDEAKAFFDVVYSEKATSNYLDKLSQQYINQHIIDRGTLNELSDKATDIIGVAKHFGIDIDPVEYLKRYTADVKKLTSEASVRKVSVDDAEHGLSMAIAMNKNTFDRDGIRFSDDSVRAKRKALKANKSIELLKDFRNAGSAYKNMEDLINDMARVEFFGDSFVTSGYYNEVKEAILETLKIFNEERDLYRAAERLENTMFRDTKLTIPQVLLRYNVPAYRVERVLVNALTLFKHVNNNYHANTGGTLDIKKVELLKNSLYFFEVLQYLHTSEEKNKLETNTKGIEYTSRFLLNVNDVDPDLIAIDDEGNPIKVVSNDINYDKMVFNRTLYQEAVSYLSTGNNLGAGTDVFKAMNKMEEKVLSNTLKDLKLVSAASPKTMGDLLDLLQSEFESAKLLYEHMEGKIKDAKYVRDNPEVIKTKVANKYAFSYFNVGNYVQSITELYNGYRKTAKELETLQLKLQLLEADIRSVSTIDETLNKRDEYFKGLVSKDTMLERLEVLKKEEEEKIQVLEKQMSDFAFNLNFDRATILLHTDDGRNIYNLYDNKPKMLTQKDIQDLQDSNLMNMDKYQAPFLSIIELYAIKNDQGETIDYDWDALFKWYKENRRFNRLTIVMKAFDDEILLKQLNDMITKVDKEWEALTPDQQKEYKNKKSYEKTRARYERIRFESVEDLEDYMQLLNNKQETQAVRFQGKEYNGMETGLNLRQHITPTLKEIDINSGKDFKAVFDFIKANGEYLIGFSDLDSVMTAMDQAYKPYRFTGKFADIIANLQHVQKLFMRYSVGFLFRNFIDTWNQLMSEMYYQQHAYGLIKEMFSPKGIVHYMGMTSKIYSAYQALSQERLTTLSLINLKYVDIEKLLDKKNLSTKEFKTIKDNIKHIRTQLFNYIDTANNLKTTDLTNRVKNRALRGTELLTKIDNIIAYVDSIPATNTGKLNSIKGRAELKQAVTFLLNMRFAEFFLMHEKMQPEHNRYANKLNRINKHYKDKGVEDYEEFKHILFEINAFMQTNAQIDQYKSDEYRKLHRLVAEQKRLDTDSLVDLNYTEVTKRIKEQEQEEYSLFQKLLGREVYEYVNERIENTGRIAGYLFDRYINGYAFDETVNRSLRRFFNYGQRTSIEMQMIADIPYLSFPVRSIDNWINRLTDPTYLRLMSDVIDGVYAQYADEDGQYDEFTQFQIQNGWLPLMKGLGVRFGHGAFDVQNILSNTGSVINQRRNPILRGVETLIRTKDVTEALSQLATIGLITRAADPFVSTPEDVMKGKPLLSSVGSKKRITAGNTFNFLYEFYDNEAGYGYEKYTPKRYANNNGRYPYYENVYKDWFNKYGRMRKPTVDPYSLVKNIQWKRYVRERQRQNILR